MGKYSRVLSNKNFLLLWFAQVTSLTAVNITFATLVFAIYTLSEGPGSVFSGARNFSVSVLAVVFLIPGIFLGAYGGVFADRHSKRAILVAINLLRAVTILALVFLVGEFRHLGAIYAVALIFAISSQFFIPAELSSLPQILPKKDLLSANSLFSITLYSTVLAGYSLGSYLFDIAGARTPLMVSAVLMLLAGGTSSLLPPLRTRLSAVVRRNIEIFKDIYREFKASFRLILTDKVLFHAITEITLGQVIVGVILALAPAYVDTVVGLPPSKGWLMILPAGLGILLGTLTIGSYANSENRHSISRYALLALGILVAILSSAAPVVTLPSDTFLYFIIFVVFMLGIVISVLFITVQTTLQTEAPRHDRGRVFGVLNMSFNVVAILPLLAAGVLADIFSVSSVFAGFSVVVLTVAVIVFSGKRRDHGLKSHG